MTACGAAAADAFRHAVPAPRPQPYRLAKPGLEQVQKGKAKPAAFQKSAAGCSLSKKLRFCAKLPMNRACGPVRRARRGVILNEKRGVYTLRAALSARLSAGEASHRSDTRLRAQSPPLFQAARSRDGQTNFCISDGYLLQWVQFYSCGGKDLLCRTEGERERGN